MRMKIVAWPRRQSKAKGVGRNCISLGIRPELSVAGDLPISRLGSREEVIVLKSPKTVSN